MNKFTLRIFLFLCILGIISANSFAQTNTIASGTYQQNFDTLRVLANATLPQGWRADVNTNPRTIVTWAGAGTTTTYLAGANMGNPLPGGIYNFGAGTSAIGNGDRAVGGLNTSNNPTSVNLYLNLGNAGGSAITTGFTVSYSIEKYRNGKNNDGSAIQLWYSTDDVTWAKAIPSGYTEYLADANNDGFSPAPDANQSKLVTATIPATAIVAAATGHLYLAWNISIPTTAIGGNASNSMALGIDNVTVGVGSAAPLGLYYRSFQTGPWNDANSWETSTSGSAPWTAGVAYPQVPTLDHSILVQTGHTITVSGNESADELTVNGSIAITGTLSIYDGSGFDITVSGGTVSGTGKLIMKSYDGGSSGVGTATLGTSTPGSITVKAVVERYLSAAFSRSAWRLLTAPLNTVSAGPVTSSIWANWQNSGGTAAGIGTAVSGPTYDDATFAGVPGAPVSDGSGLDYKTPAYSIRGYDPVTNSYPNSLGVADTKNTALFGAKNNSFLIFINGDRTSYSPYTAGGSASLKPTTLRPEGGLQMGDITFTPNATPDKMTLVGNPYASHIDLDLFRQSNTNYIKSTYYYVDPYLTGTYGVGGYVTVSYDAVGNELITPESGGTTTSPVYETRYIQSGQAMFVQTKAVPIGGQVVTFTENQKAPTTVNYIMRTQGAAVDNMRVNLNVVSSGGTTILDGVVAAFSNNYAAAIDDYDAVKIYNVGESISFMRNGSVLSIERRPEITANDVLNLNLTGLKSNVTYQFEIKPSINAAALNAFLVDNYLKTTTPIDLSKSTTINFTINGEAASTGSNRFYISFAKPAMVMIGREGISVFPNPVTNGIINLQMNNMAAGVYNVRVFNGVGQLILNRSINHTAGNSSETIQLGKGSAKGMYQLDVVKPDNTKFSTKIIAN